MADTSLVTLDETAVKQLVASAPPKKRVALGKALLAAAQFIKDSDGNYRKAFEFAKEMLHNEWYLGGELPKVIRSPEEGRPPRSEKCDKSYASLTLSDLGLSRKRSQIAQRIRQRLSMSALDAWIEEQYDEQTRKLPRIGGVAVEAKRREKAEDNADKGQAGPPSGEYGVLVIDPPWPMKKIERDEVRPNQSEELDYPTMDEAALAGLALPYAADCHVWLWTTHKFLPMAFRLLDVWHLKYVCLFVWHKPGGPQPFGLPQYNCEFAVYARKGSPSFTEVKAFKTCFSAKRSGHSRKPDEFYEMVRRTTSEPRLDMFGRREIDGFESWGSEAPE